MKYRRKSSQIVGMLFYLGVPALMIVFAARRGELNSHELWAAVIGWALVGLLPIIWTIRTRLELSEEGLTICEGIFTLCAPWQNIQALDLTPGSEGVVLHQPLPEKPARRLRRWAKANELSPSGALKGDLQRGRWIAEGRFLPLQVFKRVVHSQDFRHQLLDRVPDLKLLLPPEQGAGAASPSIPAEE